MSTYNDKIINKYDNNIKINIDIKNNYDYDLIKKSNKNYYKANSFDQLFIKGNKYDFLRTMTVSDLQTLYSRVVAQLKNPNSYTSSELIELVSLGRAITREINSKNIARINQTSAPTMQQTPNNNQSSISSNSGKAIGNTNNRWSPQSWAGAVYEFNRGVIGISENGSSIKEVLDGTLSHHSNATNKICIAFNCEGKEDMPFAAGLEASKQNILLMQFEGDNCFIYFPKNLTKEQLNKLIEELTPRNQFQFSFTYGDDVYEEQTNNSVAEFAKSIQITKEKTA